MALRRVPKFLFRRCSQQISELAQQSSNTHPKRTSNSPPQPPSSRSRDTVSHLKIAQIAEMHPYTSKPKWSSDILNIKSEP